MSVGIGAGESDGDFKIPTAEAELVPALQHATLVLKSMRLCVLHLDPESTISGGDLPRVIPFQVFRGPVPQVDSFPEGVISRVKGAVVDVELVREDENVFLSIPSSPCLGVVGGVAVDHIGHLEHFRRLGYTLDGVVYTYVTGREALIPRVHLIVAQHGIADEEGEEGEDQYTKGPDVQPTSAAPNAPTLILKVRLMKVIVLFGDVISIGVVRIRDQSS